MTGTLCRTKRRKTMKLEIRHNLDIKFNIDMEKNREDIEKLLQQASELTPEQKKILDHNERIRDELYEKIWSYLEANQNYQNVLCYPYSKLIGYNGIRTIDTIRKIEKP